MNVALSKRERLPNSIVCTAVPAFKTGEVVLNGFFNNPFVGKEWLKGFFPHKSRIHTLLRGSN
jgi:hypothetical protein